MLPLSLTYVVLAALASIAHAAQGREILSKRYDPSTHKPLGSSGCGKASPYQLGKSVTATGKYNGIEWTYRVYVPSSYDMNKPMPVILQHPGWGLSASGEEAGAGIKLYADSLGFISVTPQGMNDNPNSGGPWYSWNAAGTTQSPGPAGPTCTSAANAPSYCYTSCNGCGDEPQCDWTTCDETVTPTGTGTKDVGGFIPGLYDTLESQLCIDTTREFAAGESNGGIQTYQLGVDLASRLAAIAPQFGSFHRGFAAAPAAPVPVVDLHGSQDTTVPGNVSLSGDGYYYTTTAEIFNGGNYSKGWKASNRCDGKLSHWPTKYDGQKKLYCVSECSDHSVIRCAWHGGHNWLFNDATANGWLVTHFLLQWTKPSHVGGGFSAGEAASQVQKLEDIVVHEDTTEEATASQWSHVEVVQSVAAGHYGDPDKGCQPDEDVILAGTGRVCAPRIGVALSNANSTLPVPQCKLGHGNAGQDSGCPLDAALAPVPSHSKPTCLAKDGTADPYSRGKFHCFLMCPCFGEGSDCGHASHQHCPQGAKCERGELRQRAYGVCTYHGASSDEPSTIFA